MLRGLHFQVKHPQAEIVTVIHGRIFDVAVDWRPDSKSFGHWYGVELSDQGPRQLYMAPGFAHGFCMLSESADLHYKVSRLTIMLTREGSSGTIPDLAIQWPIVDPILSGVTTVTRACDTRSRTFATSRMIQGCRQFWASPPIVQMTNLLFWRGACP